MKHFLSLIILACILSGCHVLSFKEENDIFGITKNRDMMYTQGLILSGNQKNEDAPEIVKDIASYIPSINPTGEISTNKYTYEFGQKMFTPDHISREEPQFDANPFTGLLYGQLGKEEVSLESKKWANLLIGTTGENSLAGQTQKLFHGWFDMAEPRGWKYQVDNEIVFMHQSGLEDRDILIKYCNTKFEQTTGYNLNLGTWNTSLELFLNHRFGMNYELFSESQTSNWAFYFFNRPYIRAVLRDMTLDGNTFKDSIVTVDKEPFVYGNRFGLVMEYKGYQLELAVTTQSRLWEEQDKPWHTWGGWTISKAFKL